MKLVSKILLCCLLLIPNMAIAQNSGTGFIELPGDRALLTRVILQRLTIWTRPSDGTRIYSQNCRNLIHGCERQISTYVDYIFVVAEKYDMNPWFLAAIAWHESRFNAFAVSSAGAVGLFQLLSYGSWSRGISFVRQAWFRRRCRRVLGSCQEPVIERAVFWLNRSIEYCGSVRNGLRMYNSGRCNGPRRYARAVFNIHRDFLRRAEEIRQNDFIDPTRPQDGRIFIDDDDEINIMRISTVPFCR